MQEPQHPSRAGESGGDAPGESAFEAGAAWLEDEYVIMLEDDAEPSRDGSGRDDTLRIWCPPR